MENTLNGCCISYCSHMLELNPQKETFSILTALITQIQEAQQIKLVLRGCSLTSVDSCSIYGAAIRERRIDDLQNSAKIDLVDVNEDCASHYCKLCGSTAFEGCPFNCNGTILPF